MTDGQRLRLSDVLAEEAFRLELLSGGPGAAAREVYGAHAMEVERPSRWLGEGWIMLTTGVRLRGNAGAQRELVPQLDAGGASALGFGVGPGFKRVPRALVEVAQDRDFPVFAVPYATPFREIIHFVDNSTSSREEQLFRRLTALQRYLVDALGSPEPQLAILDRLAGFLDASVVLLSEEGDEELISGRAPADELLAKVRGEPTGPLELEAAGWHGVATTVATASDPAARWLVLASPRRDFTARLAKPAMEATAPLLSALAQLGDVAREQDQAVKASLLEEALEPAVARDVLPLAARAAAFGVDFSTPSRLVVVRPTGRSEADLAGTCRALAARLERARIPHLAHARDDEILALVQSGEAPASRALLAILESLEDVVAGVGRAIVTMTDAHHSLHDARIAADRAISDQGCRVLSFEDFDVGAFVVSEIPPARLRPKVDEILSVLHAHPALHEAVESYFAHDLDIAATAAALHLHRNSLRYRLARAEHMLGRSLKQPSAITAVYIALVAEAAGSRP